MDDAKTKLVATTNHKLSLLNEISIYTTTKEGTAALDDVLRKIKKEFGDDLGVDGNSDPAELKSFLKSVLPEYDEERVYVSDIKKLVKWYAILSKEAPEIFEAPKEEAKAEKKEEKPKEKEKAEPAKEAKSEKPKAESKEKEKPKAEKKEASKSKDKGTAKKKK